MPLTTPLNTTRSMQALLANLIDYAGLFPPAKLDMATTVRNYATYRAGADAWMLGRLIVPASRLTEFEDHAAALLPRQDGDEPWQLSVLTAAAGDEALEADIATIEAFNERHAFAEAGLAQVSVIELRADQGAAIEDALELIADEIFPFFELPSSNDPRGLLAALVGCDAGAKIRTGGVTADAFPSPENVARFILAAAAARVPLKATAGMHHPVRFLDPGLGVHQFGFVNFFLASLAACSGETELDTIIALLSETNPKAFTFADQGAAWREVRLSTEVIQRDRELLAIGFGSCSFDEPRDDLRSLGWLGHGSG